jgi:RDD family
VSWILSLLWLWHAAKNIRARTGPFNNLILACFILALVILYTIPNKSVQLLPKRILAFFLDFVLLAVLTIGVMFPLYEGDVVEPSAVVSMGIVWAWFCAFVLADWGLGGTPGQLVLGLRLKKIDNGNARPDFIKCLGRNLLALIVPIAISGRLLLIPLTYSRPEKILRLGVGFAVLILVPLSIGFTGGHTLPDVLLRVGVMPKRSSFGQYPWCIQ